MRWRGSATDCRRVCCRSRSMRLRRSGWKASPPPLPMARRRCVSCFGRGRFMTYPVCCGPWHWPIRSSRGLASAGAGSTPSRPTTRIFCLRHCAPSHRCLRCRIRQASAPKGVKEAYCALRSANCIGWRRIRSASFHSPRALRSEPWKSMPKAARSVYPACRPAQPARCATIPNVRCCALSRMPACNAACARRPAPKTSSHSSPRSISTPPARLPAFSSKRSRSAAFVAASRSE